MATRLQSVPGRYLQTVWPIGVLSSSRMKIWRSLLLMLPLCACTAMSPGMHIDVPVAQEDNAAKVVPVIKEITPHLLQLERQARANQPGPDIDNLIATPAPYRIGRGDVLAISVWGHPEFASGIGQGMAASSSAAAGSGSVGSASVPPSSGGTFTVHEGGVIELPLIGALKVGGLTQAQAWSLITTRLARVYKRPDVSLQVQVYRSKRIYLGGEVKNPGLQVIDDIPMTLTEALNRAGGITPVGDRSRIDIRRNKFDYTVSLPELNQRGIDPARILLINGDRVHVASSEESKVFVIGEVNHPLSLPLRDGQMSLNEALGDAGGLDPRSSDGRQVYVVRNATDLHPVLYHLNARSPVSLALAENFQLKPKDVVYVDAGSLVSWNRVISLILPISSGALTAAYGISRLK